VLADLGLPRIYDAQQLYQDLSYFLGNQMHENPDTKPPVNISDKDRIAQHGFDQQSFRHRK
jgi:kynurenine formamidase